MTMKNIFLIYLLLAPSLLMAEPVPLSRWQEAPTRDMKNLLEMVPTLPQQLETRIGFFYPDPGNNRALRGEAFLPLDVDGDGRLEVLQARASYINLSRILETGIIQASDQFNLPAEYQSSTAQSPAGTLAGPFDLDGDGHQEVAVLAGNKDKTSWGVWVFSVPELEQKYHFALDRAPDENGDGRNDATIFLAGSLSVPTAEGPVQALILGCPAGFDLSTRGILAVNPVNGKVLWHYLAGPKAPVPNIEILDLDGDGTREILYLGVGTGNIPKAGRLGNYGDHESRLIALDGRGRELWTAQLEGRMSGALLVVDDFLPAPGLEIITTSNDHHSYSTMRAFDCRGNILAETSLDAVLTKLRLLAGPQGKPPFLLLQNKGGDILKLSLGGNGFLVHSRLQVGGNFIMTSPLELLDHRRQPIYLVERVRGQIIELDLNLQPRLAIPNPEHNYSAWYHSLETGGRRFLIAGGVGAGIIGGLAVPNPDALPNNPVARFLVGLPLLAWLLFLIICVGLAGWWWLYRRQRKVLEVRAVLPGQGDHLEDHLRVARLHLLEDLELSGHGAMAPLRSLRRFLWLVDAVQTGIEYSPELAERFQTIWKDCHGHDLPELLAILERARVAQVDVGNIDQATDALVTAMKLLARCREKDFAPAAMGVHGGPLHTHYDRAEEALQELRGEVSALFTCELQGVIDRVLRANADVIKAGGVQVALGLQAASQGGQDTTTPAPRALCRMDPNELGFIMDNLVGNAVRSMQGCARRELRLSWLLTNGLVKLDVSDTGVGIAEKDQDLILESTYSTRRNGGLGLPRSVRLLRKYGGSLRIKSSAPGRGTTFTVLLPRARG